MGETILITGATGLVGSALSKSLRSNGNVIHYLTTRKTKLATEQDYKGFYWNPENEEIDHNCFLGVDRIIHLAGANVASRWTKKYKKEIISSRTVSTQLLLDYLKNNEHQVKQVIAASAIGIYQDSLTLIHDEEATHLSNSFLGQVVQQWEKATIEFSNNNIPTAQIRIGIVLSGEGGALVKMSDPIKKGFGAAFGTGKQWQSWIHIDDLIGIFHHVISHNLNGVYNAVAPEPVTNKILVETIAKHMNKKIWLPAVPKFVISLILGEMHTILFESQKVSADKILHTNYSFRHKKLESFL